MTDKEIIFTSRRVPNNSFELRGESVVNELKRRGYNVRTMQPHDAIKLQDKIIVWIRRPLFNMKGCYKNNINIIDPLDRAIDVIAKPKPFDAIIFPSKHTRNLFIAKHGKAFPLYVLYHQWDNKLKYYNHDHFELGYWGYRYSAVYTSSLIARKNWMYSARIDRFPPQDFFKRVSCHYNVRDKARGMGWRPTTKISIAAACGANIILNREPIHLELLPNDYPYFVENPKSKKEVFKMIKYAKETFGTDTWNYGLKCLYHVRRNTAPDKIAKIYGRIIDEVAQRGKTCGIH